MKQQSNQPKKSEEKLQKYLANYGFANRRNVADLIKASVVRVNSKKCNVNTLVKTGDIVSVDGEEHIIDLNPEVELLIYHKPVGQICSSKSRKLNESVFSSIPPRKKGKWIMVGRLDINTSGLLLFTNCGNFANFLAHPSSSIDREYLCRVYGDINDKKIDKLLSGVKLDGQNANFSDIVPVRKQGKSKNHWFYVCLFSGKNREVRRLWSSQKLTVNRLIRVRYGSFLLPENLKTGGWRKVSKKDLSKFHNLYANT